MAAESSEEKYILYQAAILDTRICDSELGTERARLFQRLNYIRSPVISRIPFEILSRIFWFATRPDDPPPRSRKPRLPDTKTPLRLCAVCSHWRRVAQSSPQLWTALVLVNKYLPYSRTLAVNYVGLVRHYYQHLGAAAISILIPYSLCLTDTAFDEVMQITLKDYAGKLRSFHFHHLRTGSLDGDPAWSAVVKYAKENTEFTQLKEFELKWAQTEKRPPENSLFRNSPRLRIFSLHGMESLQISLEFPWRQITTLELSWTGPNYSFRLLVLCPNLVNYEFRYQGHEDTSWIPPQHQIISMRFLQDLSWLTPTNFGSWVNPKPVDPQFFMHFRFPAVRKLFWHAPLPSDAPFIRDFFTNMQELEEMRIEISEWQYYIYQHMNVFSNLTTLKADIIGEEEEVLQGLWRLSAWQGGENLIPGLQRLHITVDETAQHAIIVMLYSRRNGPVDWFSPEQDPKEPVLPPYDPTSTHWQHHTRLLEFSIQPHFGSQRLDWTRSLHSDALKAMMSEAGEVEGFGNLASGRILFD